MENSNSFNSFRGSVRNLTGNRSLNSSVPVRDYKITEEELYERRRQQELRRQIQAREQELEQLSNNKERLGQRFGIHTWNQPQKVEEAGSKTRFDKTPPQRFGGGSPLRKISGSRSPKRLQQPQRFGQSSPPRQPQPQKFGQGSPLRNKSTSRSPQRAQQHSGSPLRHRSGSPARAYIPTPINSSQNDYLIQLQNDNNSLQRRLNLVLQELDRVNRDRSSLSQKFNIAAKDVLQMKRMLNEEDLDDKINRDLQMDLNTLRDKNKEAKLRIADIDQRRSDAISHLRILQGERDRYMLNNEELSKDFQRKMGMAKAIEQELFHHHDRIQKILDEIDRLKRQDAIDSAHCNDVGIVLDRLRAERDELMRKMQHLNRTYDNCVQEITRERQQMDLHNNHHTKLLVAKSLFQGLEVMQLARKQDAINEFFTYCRFDKKCHTTLKTFVDVLERLGRYKMKIAIKQWHQKAFKPIEVIDQQEELVGALANSKLMSRVFNNWRQGFNLSQNLYSHKNKAILAIWNAKCADVKKDVQRAFTIWREKSNFDKLRQRKMKYLIWKVYNNRLTSAWNNWQRNMQDADGQVRLYVLARSFTENQLKLIAFTQFKIQVHEKRRKRLNILRAYLKGWKTSNDYRAYMKVQMVNVLRFRKEHNVSLMKKIFAALRQDWEETKHQLMTSALENEVLPQIEALKQENASNVNQETEANKTRGIEMMQKMIRTWLGSYFYKWRDMQERKDFGINVHLKDIIIRAYKLRLSSSFNTWKKGKNYKDISDQQATLVELQEQGGDLMNESDQLQHKIQMRQDDFDLSARSALSRAVNICNRRFLLAGIRTWKESVDHKTKKEATVEKVVIMKLRLRFLRQAFNIYKEQTQRLKQMERNEARADTMIHQKLNKRSLQKVWNAWTAYKHTFQDAKEHQGILIKKIQLWMQRRAFHTWVAQGSQKAQELLILETDEQTQELEQLMQVSKELERQTQQNTQANNYMESDLRKQAGRILSNAFARFYNIGITRGIERWKEYVQFKKEKERIILNLLKRWREYNARFLLNALHQWREKGRIKDMDNASDQLSHEICQAQAAIVHQDDDTTEQSQALEANILAEKHQAAIAGMRFETTLKKLISVNDGNHFQSRIRACFLSWKDHTKRTVTFVKTLTHVIQNTLWHQGFLNIKEFSRDKHLTRKQNNQLQRISRMFWRRTAAAAFSKWKGTEFEIACLAIESCQSESNQEQDKYQKKVDLVKDHNGQKYVRYMGMVNKHKIWQQWKKVTNMLKAHKNAEKVTNESLGGYHQVRALRKWIERVRTTQKARDQVSKHQITTHNIYKKALFREWRKYFSASKGLCLRLANMAAKFDNLGKQQGLQMIQNFKLAKDGNYSQKKKVATQDANSILQKIYIRKLTEYMSHLRTRCYNVKSVDMRKVTVIRHVMSRELRRAFNNWRKKTDCVLTVEDVNECGPVVEEVLEARLMIKNCMDFLKNEGYTEKQIGQFEELAEQRNLDKLRRAVGHWRAHVNRVPDDHQLLPIVINRWKQFTQMRKIINHWLDFITTKKEPLKANLKQFFNRWKFQFNAKDAYLNRQDRETLANRAIKSQQELNDLSEQEVQNGDLMMHLSNQNDELYDNYLKSTRLAFALSRDNLEHTKRKAFSRMLDNSSKSNAGKFGESLGINIDRISALKSKIAEIEKDNEMLANENEELRQFTLDGYQIAKCCTNLDQEREKLSVDLADKAATIKKLLDENERLSQKLRSVQEQVVRTADEMQNFTRSNRYIENNSRREAYRQF